MSLEDAETVRLKEEPQWEDETSTKAPEMYEVMIEFEAEVKKEAPDSEAGAQTGYMQHEVQDKGAQVGLFISHTVEEPMAGPEEMSKQFLASKELTKKNNQKKKSLQSKPIRKKLYECDHCSYATHTEESLQLHEKIHYICVYCKYTAASEVSLMLHVRTHASEKPKTYTRRTYAGAEQHGQGARAGLYTKQQVKEEPLTQAGTQDRVIEHAVKVKEEQELASEEDAASPYTEHAVLVVAPEEVHRPEQLLASEGTVPDQKVQTPHLRKQTSKRYKCAYCSYTATRTSRLLNHEKIHYVCVYCKYRAASEVSLMLHVRTHASEKPKTYARRTYEGPKQRGQGARAGLYTKQQVKEEPLNEAGTRDRVIEHEVKVEPESGVRSQAGQIEEQERASEEGAAGLYTGDAVKEELVVVSEEVHRPEQLLASEGTVQDPMEQTPHLKKQTSKSFKCTYCSYTATRKSRLLIHEKRHTGEEMNKPNKSTLFVHEKKHVFGNKHKFTLCNYTADRKSRLLLHEKKHASGEINKFTIKKNLQEDKNMDEKPYKCEFCSYATDRKYNLVQHNSKHTSEKKLKCPHCSYKTNRAASMNNHRIKHNPRKLHKCVQCNFVSIRKSSLKIHQRRHTNQKLFQCDHCDYKISCKSNLVVHMKTHTNKEAYKCTECNFTSAYKSSFQIHARTHTSNEPLQCAHCDYTSWYKSNLRVHIYKHFDRKLYKCADCVFDSYYKRNLRNHTKNHHHQPVQSSIMQCKVGSRR